MQITYNKNFSKRVNSTKQPTGGTAVNVLLKNECSILEPVFELNLLDFEINYVQAFGHYYFADAVNLDGHRSELHCSIDHLASFKSQILATTAFVEYCASSPVTNLYIDDPRNGPSSVVKNSAAETAPGWSTSTTGCYVLALANAVSNGNCGAPCYYMLSPGELANIVAKIFDPNIIQVIENQFNGVFNSIVSCLWLPFTLGWASTEASVITGSAVYAGSEPLGVTANLMTKRIYHERLYAAIPNSLGYSGTYVQTGKYITATIYLPGVGVCPLNYDIFKDSATGVTVDVYLDFVTGDIVYYLSSASPMGKGQSTSFSGNVAAKVPITGASYDGVGVAAGILSTAGSIASGNPLGIARGAMSIFDSLKLDTMVLGSNSSPLSLAHNKNISVETHTQVPILGATDINELSAFRQDQGMPYFARTALSNLSGYVQCANASVDIPGDGSVQNTINSYLNSGFYIE